MRTHSSRRRFGSSIAVPPRTLVVLITIVTRIAAMPVSALNRMKRGPSKPCAGVHPEGCQAKEGTKKKIGGRPMGGSITRILRIVCHACVISWWCLQDVIASPRARAEIWNQDFSDACPHICFVLLFFRLAGCSLTGVSASYG